MTVHTFPGRNQTVDVQPVSSHGWTEIVVRSTDAGGELASTTRMRSKNDAMFLDLAIEEYTGLSRRAKLATVRLEEDAARELFAVLSAKFASPV